MPWCRWKMTVVHKCWEGGWGEWTKSRKLEQGESVGDDYTWGWGRGKTKNDAQILAWAPAKFVVTLIDKWYGFHVSRTWKQMLKLAQRKDVGGRQGFGDCQDGDRQLTWTPREQRDLVDIWHPQSLDTQSINTCWINHEMKLEQQMRSPRAESRVGNT